MATYSNPFLDPNFVLNPDFVLNTARPELNGTVQSAPQPPQPQQAQQPQQPQLPSGVGDFLASLGQAYENQGLAAPGHGRNQTIQDRAKLEGATAARQRTTFNEAFPRGRGADGLMPIPKFDPVLAYSGEAARRAGGDPRRMTFGDNNMKVNQPQVGFERLPGKTPDGGNRWQSMQAAPLSLGGVLTPQYQAPANTGRGGDFYDKATGTTSGLINYNAPDSEKYKAGNVWTAQGGLSADQTPGKTGRGNVIVDDGRVALYEDNDRTFNPPAPVDPRATAVQGALDREVAQSNAADITELQAAYQPVTAPASVGDAITQPEPVASTPPTPPAPPPAPTPGPTNAPLTDLQKRLIELGRAARQAEGMKKQAEVQRRVDAERRAERKNPVPVFPSRR